ncbi:RNA-directed DNA polymerase from mobile element jockey [Brachionus plicatilis]|uniref:RNA-directed DNA polymerase from mobile element jockey n=1 Tax=Brachionus plicatilis TaxID=10195 RepID=A0A3M7RZB5_BRAPC|nr:RNA-directed DNA polymerase from mobile element jockey [Brachionus plicatilis]
MEFAVGAWNPYRRNDIDVIEQVQRRFSKLVPELKGKPYFERREALGWSNLEERPNLINSIKDARRLIENIFTKRLRLIYNEVKEVLKTQDQLELEKFKTAIKEIQNKKKLEIGWRN